MSLSSGLRNILVHFDAGAGKTRPSDAGNGRESVSGETLARLRWYLEWSSEGGRSPHLLVPENLIDSNRELLSTVTVERVIRYHDECDVILPRLGRRGFTFIINGNQFPIFQWRRAMSAAQRQNSDVVVFGPSDATLGTDCPESVLIDAEGQVVRFKRYYEDSPAFADRWSGHAAFLVVKSEHAQAVAAHVVVRGWGLDSIGALVRRFGVRWLTVGTAIADSRIARDDQDVSTDESRSNRALASEPYALPNGNWSMDFTSRQPQAPSTMQRRRLSCDPADVAEGLGNQGNAFGRSRALDNAAADLTSSSADYPGVHESRSYLIAKRTFDIVASIAGLVLLSPFLLAVAILVKITSPGPILYAHLRQGLGGKEFACLKFRSMRTGADAVQAQLRTQNEVDGPQFKMVRDPRVTRFGQWLRRSNVDELPQLINVLFGHMSLVGPRPSPDEENQFCPAWRRARLSIRPGITGMWQVLRNREACKSDFQEWIYYDVEYARHRSFWLDLQILLYTPVAMYAPHRVAPFAARLERKGICAHSDKMIYKPA